jgi:hypothetical protein
MPRVLWAYLRLLAVLTAISCVAVGAVVGIVALWQSRTPSGAVAGHRRQGD